MEQWIPAYIEAVCAEAAYVGQRRPGIPVHTVFWGGGTPSLIPPELVNRVHRALRHYFDVRPEVEISLEANPNDLTFDYVQGIAQAGVNRLSIGVQSVHARELLLYGREHTHEMSVAAVQHARMAGIQNISVDLIFGNPDQSMQEWQATLEAVMAMNPQHVSLYGLEVKGGTELKRQVMRGDVSIPTDDLVADMYELARRVLAGHGFDHYEISNWAQRGFESRHNQQYWLDRPYFGFGAGAHGYVDGYRTIVVRSPQRYVALMSEVDKERMFPRTPATSKCARVTQEEEISEAIMLGLRLVRDGINRRQFEQRFGVDIVALRQQPIERLARLGLLEVSEECVRLTPASYFISNRVIAELA